MRIAGFLALGLLIATASFAQDAMVPDPAATRHQISPDNNWSIDDSDCSIDASWDGDTEIVVNRHFDHHDFGLYDPKLTKVAPEKVIKVRYEAAGKPAGQGNYEALGHNDGKFKSYVIEADDGLLNDFATTGSLQFYRGKALDIELNMAGFIDALSAMRACEANLPAEPMDQTMSLGEEKMLTADDETAAGAAEAAAAAAAAAGASEKP